MTNNENAKSTTAPVQEGRLNAIIAKVWEEHEKELATLVPAAVKEILDIVDSLYLDALESGSCIPQAIVFRLEFGKFDRIAITYGSRNSYEQELSTYKTMLNSQKNGICIQYHQRVAELLKTEVDTPFIVPEDKKHVLELVVYPYNDYFGK